MVRLSHPYIATGKTIALTIWTLVSKVMSLLFNMLSTTTTKSLQSCPTLCDPIDGSPPGSPVPGILQASTLEWVAISFSNAWKWTWSRSVMSDCWRPHGLQPTRLLCPWDFPGKSTGLGCHCLLWTNLTRQHIKKKIHYFANKGLSSQSYGFSSSHVWMWESDHKEGWASKNWCFQSVILEKTLKESLGQQGDQTSQS